MTRAASREFRAAALGELRDLPRWRALELIRAAIEARRALGEALTFDILAVALNGSPEFAGSRVRAEMRAAAGRLLPLLRRYFDAPALQAGQRVRWKQYAAQLVRRHALLPGYWVAAVWVEKNARRALIHETECEKI